MKTIRFKSTPANWLKEYVGIKSNTVREDPREEDIRFEILDEWVKATGFILNIEIENTFNHNVFTRKVKDVTKFKDLYIISW